MAARSSTNSATNAPVLMQNHKSGGSHGPCQPPKNSVTIIAEVTTTPTYSPTKNMPNFMPEYSVWNPAVNSCSASGRSKGSRCDSARPATTNATKPKNCGTTNHTPASDRPMNTS